SQPLAQDRGGRGFYRIAVETALDERGLDFRAPSHFPDFLEDRLSERRCFTLHAADLDTEKNQAVQKCRSRRVRRLSLVQRVRLKLFTCCNLLKIEPLKLFVKVVDNGKPADSIRHAAQARADVHFVDRFQQMPGVGFWIALAAAGNEGIVDI